MATAPTPVSTRPTGQAVLRTPSVSNAWQLGTILKAMALSDSAGGNVKLQIGARVVTAQTSLPLQVGQTLRLQVAETGRTVVLRTIGDAPQNNLIRTGIRQNLPRQTPQTPLLSTALSLAKTGTPLPAELTAAVTRLVGTLRDASTLTQGQGLRLAIRDSGNFLEHRLAQALQTTTQAQATTLPRDWKAALLRFRDQLAQLQTRIATNAGARQPARLPGPGPAGNALTLPVSVTAATSAGSANTVAIVSAAPASGPAVPQTVLMSDGIAANLIPRIHPTAPPVTGSQTITQSADVVVQPGVNTQPATPANSIPPPMRHALPHPQPVVQSGALPTDALSLVGELISNSDGALARVRLNQLASITPDHGNRMVWLLELPVRHADDRAEVVTLRIEQDEEGNGTEQKSAWTADLAFDLGSKGELRARVALRAGRVSVSFWADADQTRTEVRAKLPNLKTAMEKKQLDVATLTAGAGLPTEPPAPSASLLETKA